MAGDVKLTPRVKRLAKKLPGNSQMERVRAALAIIDAQHSAARQERMKLAAFMAIFHPGREYDPNDFEPEGRAALKSGEAK